MAIFDIACIVIVGLSILFGVIKGFVHQIMKAAGIAAAILIIINFRPDIENFLIDAIGLSDKISHFLVIPFVFFGVFIIVSILTFVIRSGLKKARFGTTDRMLGLVLGAAKGVALCAAVFFVFAQYPGASIKQSLKRHRVFTDSWAAAQLTEFMAEDYIRPYLPKDFQKNARDLRAEPVTEADPFIPEAYYAWYASLETDKKRQDFLQDQRGLRIHTEMLVSDVIDGKGGVTLISHSGRRVEMQVDYKPFPLEDKYRAGETVFIIGRIKDITLKGNGRPRHIVYAEAEEIRRIPPRLTTMVQRD